MLSVMDYTQLLNNEARHVCWPRFVRLFPQLRGLACPAIVLNNRLTKTAGRCLVEENRIDMGAKFLPKHHHEIFSVTLPHEIAHQVDYNLHGIPKGNRWHGPSWQRIMLQYGLPANPYHNMVI